MKIPKRPLRVAALAIALSTPAGVLATDATSGELFGYTIGDPYPVTEGTEVLSRGAAPSRLFTLVAGSPVKPDDIERVLLIATPVSHSIITIGVQQGFPDEASARAFGRRYLQLLSARYPASEADMEVIGRQGRIRFSDDYELVMTLLQGDAAEFADGSWAIEMLYQAHPGSAAAMAVSQRLGQDIDTMTLRQQDSRGL